MRPPELQWLVAARVSRGPLAMSRNGTDFGIRVSATGTRWFTAPVEMPSGLYFPGFSECDANPDMGAEEG
jgi:hypothetical protein